MILLLILLALLYCYYCNDTISIIISITMFIINTISLSGLHAAPERQDGQRDHGAHPVNK